MKAIVGALAPAGRCGSPPKGWLQQHQRASGANAPAAVDAPQQSVSSRESRAAFHGTPWSWARLLAKVYEVDALRCSRCGSPMKVLAAITDAPEVRRILLHLIKRGVAPPGLEISALN